MNAEKKIRTNFRLSDECQQNLLKIQEENKLSSLTAALELAVGQFQFSRTILESQYLILHELELLKKYSNEQRRNDYIVIDLLNAVTMQLDISATPMHHDKQMRSPALLSAQENLRIYMSEILTKIKENNTVIEEPNLFENERIE